MWALDPTSRPDATTDAETEDTPLPEQDQPVLVCRRCRIFISTEASVFSVTEGGAIRVFPNPSGWLRKIVTVRRADNVVPVGAGTTDFTWFAGYAWTIVVCAGCGAHLGWLYEDVAGQPLARFFGLLVDAVERS